MFGRRMRKSAGVREPWWVKCRDSAVRKDECRSMRSCNSSGRSTGALTWFAGSSGVSGWTGEDGGVSTCDNDGVDCRSLQGEEMRSSDSRCWRAPFVEVSIGIESGKTFLRGVLGVVLQYCDIPSTDLEPDSPFPMVSLLFNRFVGTA